MALWVLGLIQVFHNNVLPDVFYLSESFKLIYIIPLLASSFFFSPQKVHFNFQISKWKILVRTSWNRTSPISADQYPTEEL